MPHTHTTRFQKEAWPASEESRDLHGPGSVGLDFGVSEAMEKASAIGDLRSVLDAQAHLGKCHTN